MRHFRIFHFSFFTHPSFFQITQVSKFFLFLSVCLLCFYAFYLFSISSNSCLFSTSRSITHAFFLAYPSLSLFVRLLFIFFITFLFLNGHCFSISSHFDLHFYFFHFSSPFLSLSISSFFSFLSLNISHFLSLLIPLFLYFYLFLSPFSLLFSLIFFLFSSIFLSLSISSYLPFYPFSLLMSLLFFLFLPLITSLLLLYHYFNTSFRMMPEVKQHPSWSLLR